MPRLTYTHVEDVLACLRHGDELLSERDPNGSPVVQWSLVLSRGTPQQRVIDVPRETIHRIVTQMVHETLEHGMPTLVFVISERRGVHARFWKLAETVRS